MKKLLFFLIALILYQKFFLISARAGQACPFGRVDDPFPGSCALYLDNDNNDICDFGQSASAVKEIETVSLSKRNLSFWYLFTPAVLYFLHWFLVKEIKGDRKSWWLSRISFRYFWNLVLLLLFIPGGIFGLLIGLGVRTSFLIFYHSNLGASMVVILFCHILYRLNYFLKITKILSRR